jgi:cytochrome o ubiquinol oxidase subunit 1
VLPQVTGRDAFWAAKRGPSKIPPQPAAPAPIEVPNNSPNGFVTAFFAVVMGFALVWHIWWMAITGAVCALLTLLVFAWVPRTQTEISADTLIANERADAAARARSA